MDPISAGLTILSVIQTAVQTAEALHDFVKTVKDAPEEVQALVRETNILFGVLNRIKTALEDPTTRGYVSRNPDVERDLASLEDSLAHYNTQITDFMAKLEKSVDRGVDGKRSMKSSIRWYFKKDEVMATRSDLQQTRDNANFALSGISFALDMKDRAQQDALNIERQQMTLSPSPLLTQIEQLQKEGDLLRQAASDGDNRIIKMVLDAGTPVDSKDSEGRTALSFAAEHGKLETVQLLLESKASAKARANDIKEGNWFKRASGKRTPLHWAACRGHVGIAELLLSAGAEIEKGTSFTRTAAMEAAENGHFEMMVFLLDKGANVNAKTYNGWTILHMAVIKKDVRMVEHILARGADTEIVYKSVWHHEQDKRTHQIPLHYAMKQKCRPESDETVMVRLLLQYGKGSLSKQDSLGNTPIHAAVKERWAAGLDLCLKSATAADIKIRDVNGIDALTYASGAGDGEMVDLIKARSDVESSFKMEHLQSLLLQNEEEQPRRELLSTAQG